jgi:hypothetical protein
MAEGRTLWQMLMEKLSPPVEFQVYNPLHARIDSPVTIDEIELRDQNFFLREIRENRRSISGRLFVFVDYVLVARSLQGEETLLRLRLNPVDDPERHAGLTHHALLLRLYDDLPYSEDLHGVVKDTTRTFQVLEDGKVAEEYRRLNDTTDAYRTQVTILKDKDHNRKITPDEVERLRIEYWDYWREVPDEAGQPLRQYLFVEMEANCGWFQIWRGQEIDPQKVMVF